MYERAEGVAGYEANRRIKERVDLLFDKDDLNVLVSGFDGGEESLNGGDTGKGATDDDHLDKFCCLCHYVLFMRVERKIERELLILFFEDS